MRSFLDSAEGDVPKFDVAFIGTGIAGLYAAAFLVKAGKKVILVDPRERAGGTAALQEKEGFRFIAGPNIGYGFEPGGPAHALCAVLGLSAEEQAAASRFQVALPDRRITVSPDVQETLSELRREFPREIDGLSQLYQETNRMARTASKSGLSLYVLRRRSADAYLRARNFSRELTAYFDVQSRFFFGQDIRNLPLSLLVLLLTTPPRTFPNGLGTIADRMIAVIEDHKDSMRLREQLPEMTFRRRRITGMRTSQGSIEPRSFVVNAVWGTGEHTMFIALRQEVVPVGMECTVISLPDYSQPEETVALALSREGSSTAPSGMRTLTAAFYGQKLPNASPETRTERVRSIIPFLSDFIVMIHEQGENQGRYILPKEISVTSLDPRNASILPVPNSMNNLYLLPDSTRALHRSLEAGGRVANKLR